MNCNGFTKDLFNPASYTRQSLPLPDQTQPQSHLNNPQTSIAREVPPVCVCVRLSLTRHSFCMGCFSPSLPPKINPKNSHECNKRKCRSVLHPLEVSAP